MEIKVVLTERQIEEVNRALHYWQHQAEMDVWYLNPFHGSEEYRIAMLKERIDVCKSIKTAISISYIERL